MKKSFRKFLNWRLVGKVAFGMIYLLLGAEVFIRIFAPEPILPRYVCATSYGIRGNNPNRNYWHTTPEYRINIQTNSKGIRAPEEIPYEKPAGVKRIVVLGDSFGIGYGVDLENTFTNQMKNFLTEAGVISQIVNLSVSGHGTSEQLIVFREQGWKYQPDLVLLVWHGSDLADNVRANLYSLEDDRLVPENKTYLPGVKTREFLFQFAAYRFLAEYSHLYSCVRENAALLVKNKVLPAIRSLSNAGAPAHNIDADAVERAAEYRKNLAIKLLEQINKECLSHGARFLILDVPYRLSRTEFSSGFPENDDGDMAFKVFCPIELFKQQRGENLYWERSHGHFTPLGCRIVGKGLAEIIFESDLIN